MYLISDTSAVIASPSVDIYHSVNVVAMPALPQWQDLALQKRDWRNTVGQSGMTPTAFAFLIPVFVVVVFCPLYVCSAPIAPKFD